MRRRRVFDPGSPGRDPDGCPDARRARRRLLQCGHCRRLGRRPRRVSLHGTDGNGHPYGNASEQYHRLRCRIELRAGDRYSGHLDDGCLHRDGRCPGYRRLHDHGHGRHRHHVGRRSVYRADSGRSRSALVHPELCHAVAAGSAGRGPINIVGLTSLFAPILQISEQNYIGGFAAANVTTPGCGTPAVPATYFASATLDTTTPAGLPTAAPGSSVVYYTITGQNAIVTTGGCSIKAVDSFVPASTNSISVEITTVTGVFQ
jgi:hypothetical protein